MAAVERVGPTLRLSDEDDRHIDIQFSLIDAVHRHAKGFIPFAARDDEGTWANVRSIASQDLGQYRPWIRDRLSKDSYIGINADRSGRRRRDSDWLMPVHNTAALAFLCANYCDIDYQTKGLTCGQAFGTIVDYERDGVIPPPSLIGQSGRGLWLLWLLRDPKLPQSSHVLGDGAERENALDTYIATQQMIVSRLAEIGADACGIDPARWWRIPGSFRTDVERYVKYRLNLDQRGQPFMYTQQELAQFLNVRPRARRIPSTQSRDSERVVPEYRRRAWRSLQITRLQDVQELIKIRGGGFIQGCRHHGAVVLALTLKQNGYSRQSLTECVHDYGRRCRPPMKRAEVDCAVRSVYPRDVSRGSEGADSPRVSRLSDRLIAKWLRITPKEAALLQRLRSADHYDCPISTVEAAAPNQCSTDVRRRMIRQICGDCIELPSTRQMARFLSDAGLKASHVSVAADYRALGMSGKTRAAAQSKGALVSEQDTPDTRENSPLYALDT